MGYTPENYNTVAERLQEARGKIKSIVTEPPVMLTDVMGYMRATVELKDGEVGTGTASFRLDLQTRSAQATNPIEDCETSAVGRALAMLGYATTKSVASREEVVEARSREGAPPPRGRPTSGAVNYQPVQMDEVVPICPEHRVEMRRRTGVNQETGKPWARWSCPERVGNGYCKQGKWID